MNCFPDRETIEKLREKYSPGTLVELVYMGEDPYSRLKPGDKGVVSTVDDAGTIFVNWRCGSGLGIVFGVDSVRIITEPGESKDEEGPL